MASYKKLYDEATKQAHARHARFEGVINEFENSLPIKELVDRLIGAYDQRVSRLRDSVQGMRSDLVGIQGPGPHPHGGVADFQIEFLDKLKPDLEDPYRWEKIDILHRRGQIMAVVEEAVVALRERNRSLLSKDLAMIKELREWGPIDQD